MFMISFTNVHSNFHVAFLTTISEMILAYKEIAMLPIERHTLFPRLGNLEKKNPKFKSVIIDCRINGSQDQLSKNQMGSTSL